MRKRKSKEKSEDSSYREHLPSMYSSEDNRRSNNNKLLSLSLLPLLLVLLGRNLISFSHQQSGRQVRHRDNFSLASHDFSFDLHTYRAWASEEAKKKVFFTIMWRKRWISCTVEWFIKRGKNTCMWNEHVVIFASLFLLLFCLLFHCSIVVEVKARHSVTLEKEPNLISWHKIATFSRHGFFYFFFILFFLLSSPFYLFFPLSYSI